VGDRLDHRRKGDRKMNTDEFLDRLQDAVMLRSDDAAIRIHAEYQPLGGPTAKVFPPTYLPSDGSRYHFEERWGDGDERVKVVLLDSFQSQANRAEVALREVAEEVGLPQVVMEVQVAGRTIRVSSLDAPHRSRDAYFLDSELDSTPFDETEIGKALNGVTAEDATSALRYAPYDLVFGVWDSHRGKRIATKFPRSYCSEMIGWDAIQGDRAATKGDPLNLPGESAVPLAEWRPETQTGQKKKAELKLNELGHGMIPGTLGTFARTGQKERVTAPGVSVRSITRDAVVSLTGLARFRFPVGDDDASSAGRTALAALALLGDRLAFAGAGLHLRSGSDLVLVSERVEWVRRGAETEAFELSADDARQILVEARDRLAGVGVVWSGEPVVLRPSQRLREVIEQSFYVASLEE
jgi:CRISPR-associated protein Csb1